MEEYIKQLEQQNEQLKRQLSEKEVENEELYRRLEYAGDEIRWLQDVKYDTDGDRINGKHT